MKLEKLNVWFLNNKCLGEYFRTLNIDPGEKKCLFFQREGSLPLRTIMTGCPSEKFLNSFEHFGLRLPNCLCRYRVPTINQQGGGATRELYKLNNHNHTPVIHQDLSHRLMCTCMWERLKQHIQISAYFGCFLNDWHVVRPFSDH